MDRSERISRYENGESISSIARNAKVSRQAVIRSLQRAGVHGDVVVESEVRDKPVVAVKKAVAGLPFDPADLGKTPNAKGRLGRNLSMKGDKYVVFDLGNGGERRFDSLEEIKSEYKI